MKIPAMLLLVAGVSLPLQRPAVPHPQPIATEQQPMAPGPQHALLAKLAGTWRAFAVSGPAGEEHRQPAGTLTTVAITPFHTVSDFRSGPADGGFVGHAVDGYCPVQKEFYRLWTDSMSPSPMELRGHYDADRHTLTMTGTCYGRSHTLEPCRAVVHFVDDDHYTYTLLGSDAGGHDVPVIRLEYERQR